LKWWYKLKLVREIRSFVRQLDESPRDARAYSHPWERVDRARTHLERLVILRRSTPLALCLNPRPFSSPPFPFSWPGGNGG
jgi:hypothetical protein